MPVYFLRHGQSKANIEGVFAGQKENSPLSELGFEQAEAAAQEIATVGIARIVTSPLVRARQTAETVASKIGFAGSIKVDARIAEYDMGVLTGQPNRDITSRELVSAEGAEDPIAFRDRVVDFLKELRSKEDTTLIVSHAGVGRIIEAAKQGIDPAEFYSIEGYPNAHVIELDLGWLDNYE